MDEMLARGAGQPPDLGCQAVSTARALKAETKRARKKWPGGVWDKIWTKLKTARPPLWSMISHLLTVKGMDGEWAGWQRGVRPCPRPSRDADNTPGERRPPGRLPQAQPAERSPAWLLVSRRPVTPVRIAGGWGVCGNQAPARVRQLLIRSNILAARLSVAVFNAGRFACCSRRK
jgi:hypothetical protein